MLDAAHFRILAELQREARLTNVELARRVALSESACLRKTKELEESGVITGFHASVDPGALGLNIHAIILIHLDQRLETETSEFFSSIAQDDRIKSCLAITGPYDLVLEAYVKDVADLSALTLDHLLKLPSVRDVVTCIGLRSFPTSGFARSPDAKIPPRHVAGKPGSRQNLIRSSQKSSQARTKSPR